MALIEQHCCASTYKTKKSGVSFWNALALWRSRAALEALDARALEDIGVHPTDAQREAQRALWDVPASWTQR